MWWLLWSTTPRANTHTHTAKTQECVSDVCVCVGQHSVSGWWWTKCCAGECLCSWNQETINNYFSPSADNAEMRKGCVLSAPLTGRMGSEPGGGGGFMDKPLRAEKKPFEMKRLYFVWWQSVWRSKSLHVLGSRRWFFLIGVLQTTVHYPVFILTVCINEVNKQSLLKEDCKLCLLAGLHSISGSVNDRKLINTYMDINLLNYYQRKMPNMMLVPVSLKYIKHFVHG